MSSIKQVILEFNQLEKCLKTDDLEIFVLNEFSGLVQERIFSRSKAVDNTTLGTYRSEAYKEKRKKAGRKTNIKDLQFTGDFVRDLDLGKANGKNAFGFKSDLSAKIVEGQENGSRTKSGKEVMQINKPVFAANQEEYDIVSEKINEEVDRILKECLNL